MLRIINTSSTQVFNAKQRPKFPVIRAQSTGTQVQVEIITVPEFITADMTDICTRMEIFFLNNL